MFSEFGLLCYSTWSDDDGPKSEKLQEQRRRNTKKSACLSVRGKAFVRALSEVVFDLAFYNVSQRD
jgi:hypothetical protein